jgi:hypothetical protein
LPFGPELKAEGRLSESAASYITGLSTFQLLAAEHGLTRQRNGS